MYAGQNEEFSWDLSSAELDSIEATLPDFDPQPDERIPNTATTLWEAIRGGAKFRDLAPNDQEVLRSLRRTSIEDDLIVGQTVHNLLECLPDALANIDQYFSKLPDMTSKEQRELREIRDSFLTVGDYGDALAKKGMCPETFFQVFVGLELLDRRVVSTNLLAPGDLDLYLKGEPLHPDTEISHDVLEPLVKGSLKTSIANQYATLESLEVACDLLLDWTKEVIQAGVPFPQLRS